MEIATLHGLASHRNFRLVIVDVLLVHAHGDNGEHNKSNNGCQCYDQHRLSCLRCGVHVILAWSARYLKLCWKHCACQRHQPFCMLLQKVWVRKTGEAHKKQRWMRAQT